MMIFRLSCPHEVSQVVSSTAVRSQSWPIFIVPLKARDLIEKRRFLSSRGARATRNPYPRHIDGAADNCDLRIRHGHETTSRSGGRGAVAFQLHRVQLYTTRSGWPVELRRFRRRS